MVSNHYMKPDSAYCIFCSDTGKPEKRCSRAAHNGSPCPNEQNNRQCKNNGYHNISKQNFYKTRLLLGDFPVFIQCSHSEIREVTGVYGKYQKSHNGSNIHINLAAHVIINKRLHRTCNPGCSRHHYNAVNERNKERLMTHKKRFCKIIFNFYIFLLSL